MKQFETVTNNSISGMPLLGKIVKYRSLLPEYPKIMSTLLDMIRHVFMQYTGRMSLAEACDIPFMTDKRFASDVRLRTLYTKHFAVCWKQLSDSKLVDNYPELFDLGFQCQQGINFKDYLAKVIDPDKVRFIDFIFPPKEVASKESLVPVAFLQTFTNRLHNAIMKDIRSPGSDIPSDTVSKPHTVEIKKALENDFARLTIDLDQLVIENSTLDPRTNSSYPFIIDLWKVQAACATDLFRPEILCEEYCMQQFQFSESIAEEHWRQAKRRLHAIENRKLHNETLKFLSRCRRRA